MKVKTALTIVGITLLVAGLWFFINAKKAIDLDNSLETVLAGKYNSFRILYNDYEKEFDLTANMYQELNASLISFFESFSNKDPIHSPQMMRGDVTRAIHITFFDDDMFVLKVHFGYADKKEIIGLQIFDKRSFSINKYYFVDGNKAKALFFLLDTIYKK